MPGDRATSALAGTRFTDVRWTAETGSTNADALELARAGAPEGTVVVADHQTAGRGRLDRAWVAPPGSSLLVSVLLRPPLALGEVHLAVQAVALSAADACERLAGVAPRLKWPNDLLEPDGDRKLGGILAESVVRGERLTGLVVGLGCNVDWPDALPPELVDRAVALSHLTSAPPERVDLLVELLRSLDGWCEALASESGRDELRARYRERCATIGARVRVERDLDVLVGTATGVADDGALELRGDDGATVRVDVGDVVHLRPV